MTPQIPLFEGIADPGFAESLSSAPLRKFPKGMVIFEQGETTEDVYCVSGGLVEIVLHDKEGDLKHIADLGPGSVFGEFSYLTGTPRSTAAVAKEQTTLLELTPSWLREVEERHPEIRERLLALYRTRVLQNVLKTSRLFSVLDADQLDRLSLKMVLKNFRDGDEILREGATDLSLLVIKKGKAIVTKLRGKDRIVLGEVASGEVLGEMAAITGEPRSASAHATGDLQAMELPGEDFKTALSAQPRLLKAVEDIVRSRAEQTRRAVEEMLDEVVGHQWTDADDIAGIHVDSLKAMVEFPVTDRVAEGKLLRASLHRWELESAPGSPAVPAGTPLSLTLRKERIKELDAALVRDPLPGYATVSEGSRMAVEFRADPALQSRLSRIVTSLARARVRLFVYPEYDVSRLAVTLEFRTRAGLMGFCGALSISLTHARIRASDAWNPGEIAQVTLHKGSEEVATMRAVCLEKTDGLSEVQFEFETGAERSTLEALLKTAARELGYGQPSATTAPPRRTPTRSAVTLTKFFKTPGEFVRTYMGSIESGLIRVQTRDKLKIGTAAAIHLSIGGERGVRKITLSGLVREWKTGTAEIELDELSSTLREKIEQLCKRLVEERADRNWERRKNQLVQSGIRVPDETAASSFRRAGIAAAVVCALGLAWWGLGARNRKEPVVEPTRPTDASPQPRDALLTLQSTEGPVTFRTTEIRSLKLNSTDGSMELAAAGKTFTIPPAETPKLPSLLRSQMEKLNAWAHKK